MGNEVIWIARMGDLLSCLVVVASESIERFIEPDSEDEPADPNIIYEEPDDEASSSDKDVSDATLPLWVIGRAALSDQGPGHKGPGTIQVRRTPEVTAMSRNLTYRPKRRANTRTGHSPNAKPLGCLSRLGDRSAIGVLRDINQGNKSGAYDDAACFHFVEVPGRGKGCR
ncbi:hypothetical protein AgCh_019054 [Apium graveolens]